MLSATCAPKNLGKITCRDIEEGDNAIRLDYYLFVNINQYIYVINFICFILARAYSRPCVAYLSYTIAVTPICLCYQEIFSRSKVQ